MPNDKLYTRIESAGVEGIKKTKLRREFGVKSGKAVDELLSQGLIFAEKRAGTVTYWSKDNYMQHLVSSDPKFRLIYDMYANTNSKISNTVSRISSNLDKKVSNITSEIIDSKVSNIASVIDKKVSNITSDLTEKVSSEVNRKVVNIVKEVKVAPSSTKDDGNHNGKHLTLDQFKMEFDRTIAEIPTSIGWVELAMIRERVCDKYSISKQNFYTFASQLFDQFNNSYELSSGGNEGVMVRGLVHGFVRCI